MSRKMYPQASNSRVHAKYKNILISCFLLFFFFSAESCSSTWKEQSATTGGDNNHAGSGHFRQHWIFLESFLTISSYEASQTTIRDTSHLVLESAQKLFSSIYQTHPIEDIEMDLCTKGLSSLAKICDTKHQVHDSLRSAAMDFVKRSIVEICNWRRPLEVMGFSGAMKKKNYTWGQRHLHVELESMVIALNTIRLCN